MRIRESSKIRQRSQGTTVRSIDWISAKGAQEQGHLERDDGLSESGENKRTAAIVNIEIKNRKNAVDTSKVHVIIIAA